MFLFLRVIENTILEEGMVSPSRRSTLLRIFSKDKGQLILNLYVG